MREIMENKKNNFGLLVFLFIFQALTGGVITNIIICDIYTMVKNEGLVKKGFAEYNYKKQLVIKEEFTKYYKDGGK